MLNRLIVSILIFFSISFKVIAQESYDRNDNFEYLFNYSHKLFTENDRLDSISEILYDSIAKQPFFYVETEEIISETSNSFSFRFKKVRPNLNIDVDYWLRNLHVILLNRYDSVFVNGNLYSNSENYINNLKEYYLNPDNKDNLPEKYLDSIKYFGEVLITKSFVFFDTQMQPDSSNIKTSFEKLFEMVDLTVSTILEIRNEVSLFKWKMPYGKLETSKRVAISKKHPLRIHIYFDYKPQEIPPPPPEYEEYNFDKIENSFDSLMRKRLK